MNEDALRGGEAPVPDDAAIQKMLRLFKEMTSNSASPPSFEYPCRNRTNYAPRDLPALDKEYTLADATGRIFNISPLYYDALSFKGRQTKVFAWIGLPADDSGDAVPGMVCVHGGGGTAFKDWVEQWVKRGYAAISIAVEGQTDEKMKKPLSIRGEEFSEAPQEDLYDPLVEMSNACVIESLSGSDNNPHNKNPSFWVEHSHPGPRRPDVAFADFDEALENQWMYHCVADTILANTLMRSLYGKVDPRRVGVTGISWGGVITSTVAGLDTRFSHIIPIYGCGNLGHAESYLGRGIKGHIRYYEKVWDACLYLPQATMPSLWISWPEDPHFPMINLKHSYESMGTSVGDGEGKENVMVSLIPGLQHGHAVGWRRAESYTFAKYVWDKAHNKGATAKTGWCKQISGDAIHRGGLTMVQVKFSSSLLAFHKAEVIWTQDSEDVEAGARRWQASPAILKSSATTHLWAAEAPVPPEADAWIINLYSGQDKNTGLVVTSTYQDLTLFAFAVELKAEDTAALASRKKRFWMWQ